MPSKPVTFVVAAVLAVAVPLGTVHGGDKVAAKVSLAPVHAETTSTHGPFESGDCDQCHAKRDPRNPGKLRKAGNELCFDCHDDFRGAAAKEMSHPPLEKGDACTGCHNPHNSQNKSLLLF